MRGFYGKKPRLTAERADSLVRDYETWRQLCPAKLCAKYGISRSAMNAYVRRRHKVGPHRRAAKG